MLVKAKWNIKDSAGWHATGEIFQTSDHLGNAVVILEEEKPNGVSDGMQKPAGSRKAEPKPRTSGRRKKAAE